MRPPILLLINVCHYLIVLKTKQKGVHFNYKPSVRPLNNLLVRHLIYTGVMPLYARFHIIAGFACLTPHYLPGPGPNLSFRKTAGLVVTLSPSAYAAFIYTKL